MIDYTVFATSAGSCAIAWSEAGIAGLQLPGDSHETVERSLLRRRPQARSAAAPDHVLRVIEQVQRYFAGERIEFDSVPLDLGSQSAFFRQIYEAARCIAWGTTTTYGALARQLGAGPEAARTVGQAMAKNPVPLIIPCHRVLAAGGQIGGFSAPGGIATKTRMLALEGIRAAPSAADQRSLEL